MAAPAKKSGARTNSTKKRPAEQVEVGLPSPDKLEEQAKSPYPPDVRVYAYQPKDGSEPILLAMNGFEVPDKLWHFDLAQLPVLSQTWAWMRKANIPKEIQRRTQMLPDKEYFDMFDEWFEAMRVLNASGPKGSVTSAK